MTAAELCKVLPVLLALAEQAGLAAAPASTTKRGGR
jgi:hypothetical protein